MVKTGVQKCGTNWRVILQGEAHNIETKHWSFFNHGATKAELEWETETCAHFWSTPEKILKALQKAHLFSLWNKADLIGDEPEAKQYTERAKKRAQLEFDQMEILSNFKPIKTVSVLNLDYFSEGTPYAEKLDNDA